MLFLTKRKFTVFLAIAIMAGFVATGCANAAKKPAKTQDRPERQRYCPVKGGKINKKYYAEYEGKCVYFCCPGCKAEFEKNPEKYTKKMEERGVRLKEAPCDTSAGHHHCPFKCMHKKGAKPHRGCNKHKSK